MVYVDEIMLADIFGKFNYDHTILEPDFRLEHCVLSIDKFFVRSKIRDLHWVGSR